MAIQKVIKILFGEESANFRTLFKKFIHSSIQKVIKILFGEESANFRTLFFAPLSMGTKGDLKKMLSSVSL